MEYTYTCIIYITNKPNNCTKSMNCHGIQSDCRFPFCPLVKPQYQMAAVP